MYKKITSQRGFNLNEILVIVGIIAILAAIVIIAINPTRQFGQVRDTQRQSNLNAILNAVGQNIADNKGTLTGCAGTAVSAATTTIGTGSGNADLAACLVPVYLPTLPTDPSGGTAANTGYTITKWPSGRYVVAAPNAEITTPIQIVR